MLVLLLHNSLWRSARRACKRGARHLLQRVAALARTALHTLRSTDVSCRAGSGRTALACLAPLAREFTRCLARIWQARRCLGRKHGNRVRVLFTCRPQTWRLNCLALLLEFDGQHLAHLHSLAHCYAHVGSEARGPSARWYRQTDFANYGYSVVLSERVIGLGLLATQAHGRAAHTLGWLLGAYGMAGAAHPAGRGRGT